MQGIFGDAIKRDLTSKARILMSHCAKYASAAPGTVIGALSALLRSRGLSSAAIIDGHAFFRTGHSPTMQCASIRRDDCKILAIRPVSSGNDLEDLRITESVERFVEHPGRFCSDSDDLVQAFLADWAAQVAQSSRSPDLIHQLVDILFEVERWLSDDGPGSCVLLRDWVIWSSGRHGMSDLYFAKNAGTRPDPILITMNRWDHISTFGVDELVQLAQQLGEWKQMPSVWAFTGRKVPATT